MFIASRIEVVYAETVWYKGTQENRIFEMSTLDQLTDDELNTKYKTTNIKDICNELETIMYSLQKNDGNNNEIQNIMLEIYITLV